MYTSRSKTPRQRIRTQMFPSPARNVSKQHRIPHTDKLKVFIKFRPETADRQRCIKYLNQKQIEIQNLLHRKVYTFDHIFDSVSQNEQTFKIGCQDIINDVFEGMQQGKTNNNGLIFVYGNTGTGKTHTMGLIDELDEQSQGIVPQSLTYMFTQNQVSAYEICLSFCEIYKDQVYDLLDFQDEKKQLNIREHQKTKQPYLQDLIMIEVSSFDQAAQLINIGLEKRKIAQQKMNRKSSRGHGIVSLHINKRGVKSSPLYTGKISFVDLAGCQRVKESESMGSTFNEALHINTSLSALETLLMNISDKNVRSYRGNKLTRLLQPYFQFGKIRLFVTSNYDSLHSIEFAKRCKGIKFLEKDAQNQHERVCRTPRKRYTSSVSAAGVSNKEKAKYEEKLLRMKQQYHGKERILLKCISNLVSLIYKIHESTANAVSCQPSFSSFSLPELFSHLPLQSKVNEKINIFQRKQEEILLDPQEEDHSSSKISQISTTLSQSFDQESNQMTKKAEQVMRSMAQVGFSIVNRVSQLSQLIDYKNIYKKEWFTSQIKGSILQNKNTQFEKAINFMADVITKTVKGPEGQAKLFRKLKQFGVNLEINGSGEGCSGKRLSQTKSKNQTLKGKLRPELQIQKNGKIVNPKQHYVNTEHQNSQYQFNRQRKRSLIYIDED